MQQRASRVVPVTIALPIAIGLVLAIAVGYLLIDARAFGRPADEAPRLDAAAAPQFPSPQPVLRPAQDASPSVNQVNAALAPLLSRPEFGTLGLSVVDLNTGTELAGRDPLTPLTPASTTKLATAAAVLTTVGPEHRLATRVVAGSEPGEVVLVGGGDPTLSLAGDGEYPDAARLDELAAQVKAKEPAVRRVVVDSTLFTGPTTGPAWPDGATDDGYAAPIYSVMLDGGRVAGRGDSRTGDADLAAGRALAEQLGLDAGSVARATAPTNAETLGSVQSPSVRSLVEFTLRTSDNVLAEALARQVALAEQQPATFAGSATAISTVLTRLGITAPVQLADGSGLSSANQISPRALTEILALAASDERLRAVLTGLPVASYDGTLADRFGTAPAGVGVVRAKTGTLSQVSSLAGVVTPTSGGQLAFAALANGASSETAARQALDELAAALAAL